MLLFVNADVIRVIIIIIIIIIIIVIIIIIIIMTKLTSKTYLQLISLKKKRKYLVKALFASHFIS